MLYLRKLAFSFLRRSSSCVTRSSDSDELIPAAGGSMPAINLSAFQVPHGSPNYCKLQSSTSGSHLLLQSLHTVPKLLYLLDIVARHLLQFLEPGQNAPDAVSGSSTIFRRGHLSLQFQRPVYAESQAGQARHRDM